MSGNDGARESMGQAFEPQNVAVLSAGAWGIVLAAHLARSGHRVVAYDLPAVVEALAASRTHPKLPGFAAPESLRLTSDLSEALRSPAPDCLVVATPGHALRAVAKQCDAIETAAGAQAPWIVCTKSIEEDSLLTMGQVVEQVRGPSGRYGVLSGPSFAAEVALGKPTTVCVASRDAGLGAYAQALFMTETFRVYTQDDVLGVEIGGATKNVIAIAAGVCDAMALGDNARAALITRGLAEIERLGVAMGARSATFAGLTGMGDLILTCGGTLSRNHRFGELLAQGRSCAEALDEIGMVVEGMSTARSVYALARRLGVEMPITRQVHAVIYEGKSPQAAVRDLMRRDARPERD